jgi:preprotein translocase subunit SecG
MAFLKGFLIVLEVITSTLLVCVILVQKTKGGMGTAMGGMGEQVFGSRMGNVLTKATVWLVAIFLVNTLIIARLGSAPLPESVTDVVPVEQPAAAPIAAPMEAPAPAPGPETTGLPEGLEMPLPLDPVEASVDTPEVEAVPVEAPAVEAELPAEAAE